VLVRPFISTALLMMTGLAAAQQPSPSTADVKSELEQGMSAFRAHDYKRALAILNEVTATDPNNVRRTIWLVIVLWSPVILRRRSTLSTERFK
jgi:Flp pilus assembly protein TadD